MRQAIKKEKLNNKFKIQAILFIVVIIITVINLIN